VNADHLALLKKQEARGWKGRIVTNPNCVVVVYAMALAPLRQFGLKSSVPIVAAGDLGRRLSRRAVVGHSR
jgi:aspartate-semialdehyde dehydrogenase